LGSEALAEPALGLHLVDHLGLHLGDHLGLHLGNVHVNESSRRNKGMTEANVFPVENRQGFLTPRRRRQVKPSEGAQKPNERMTRIRKFEGHEWKASNVNSSSILIVLYLKIIFY